MPKRVTAELKPRPNRITARQRVVLAAVHYLIQAKRTVPTDAEIAKRVRRSKTAVNEMVGRLVRDGFLERQAKSHRGTSLTVLGLTVLMPPEKKAVRR